MRFLQQPAGAPVAPPAPVAPATPRVVDLQATVQQTVEKALADVQKAVDGQSMSVDAKNELKAEIRQAIDAAREATDEARLAQNGPPVTYSSRGESNNDGIPPQVPVILGIMGVTLVLCVVGFPIARAFARLIDRRGTTPPAASREVTSRLEAIEQAVDSVAVEVERISEGQRFTARVLSERAQEPAREFMPLERDAVPVAAPANARRS